MLTRSIKIISPRPNILKRTGESTLDQTRGRILNASQLADLVHRETSFEIPINGPTRWNIVTGCFDGLHQAHLNILSEVKFGPPTYILVGLNTDQWIRQHKNRSMVQPFRFRASDIYEQLMFSLKRMNITRLPTILFTLIEEEYPKFLGTMFSDVDTGYDPFHGPKIFVNYYKGIEYLVYKTLYGELPEVRDMVAGYNKLVNPQTIHLTECFVDNVGLPHSSDLIKHGNPTESIQ